MRVHRHSTTTEELKVYLLAYLPPFVFRVVSVFIVCFFIDYFATVTPIKPAETETAHTTNAPSVTAMSCQPLSQCYPRVLSRSGSSSLQLCRGMKDPRSLYTKDMHDCLLFGLLRASLSTSLYSCAVKTSLQILKI